MDRAQATGFGVSAAGHIALLVILSLGFAATQMAPPRPAPIEVSFVKDVGAVSAAPVPSPAPPAPSVAPDTGPPEEAAPAPVATPKPPEPVAAPAPPKPVEAERPKPRRPAERTASAPAMPKAAPAPVKPAHAARAGTAPANRGSRLGPDFLKGIGSDPSPSRSQRVQGSAISAEALASIQAAILRQIQPCANRQVNPGPGADKIKVTLNLRLNRDGSLAQTPRVVGTSGITDENGRYQDRVKDLAIAAYVGCAPLHDLPEDLYRTPKGGWGNINMSYKLP